ncbi:hypothetical protein BDF22DRAFT_677389 [Syncephalis plumigaleata]|nr:hypothetical protein BDF22DRAFT_677389 [Syncephalis plumigaleata]
MSLNTSTIDTPLLLGSSRVTGTKQLTGTVNVSLDALGAMFSDNEEEDDYDNSTKLYENTKWSKRPTQKRQHRRHKLAPAKSTDSSRTTKKTKRQMTSDPLDVSTPPKRTRSVASSSTNKVKTVSDNFVRLKLGQRGQKRTSRSFRRTSGVISKRELASTNSAHLEELYQVSIVDDNSFDISFDTVSNKMTSSKETNSIDASWLEKRCVASPIHDDQSTIVQVSIDNTYNIDIDRVISILWPDKSVTLSKERIDRLQRLFNGENVLLLNDDDCNPTDYELVASIHSALPAKSISLVIIPESCLHCQHLDTLPSMVHGACLHGYLPANAYSSIITRLLSGELDILYITTERFISHSFANILRNPRMPTVQFICIQSSQQLSPYSDRFQLASIRLKQVISTLKTSCGILATGNAWSTKVHTSISYILDEWTPITITNAATSSLKIRRNLQLTSCNAPFKDAALVDILQRPDIQYTDGIVVYVIHEYQVEYLISHLRKASITATSISRGMTMEELALVENQWISGQYRVLVTSFTRQSAVPSIRLRGIIYYDMPASMEHYLCDIHQVGKDGRPAFVHTFLDKVRYQQRKSYAYRDSTESWALRRLFSYLFFTTKKDNAIVKQCTIEGVSMLLLSWDVLEKELNMTRYTLQLILYLMTCHSSRLIHIISPVFNTGKVHFTRMDPHELADKYPVVDALLRSSRLNRRSCLFSMVKACELLDKSPLVVQSELEQLKRQNELRVEFSDEALLLQVNLSTIETQTDQDKKEEMLDRILDQLQSYLMDTLCQLECYRLDAVEQMYKLVNYSDINDNTATNGSSDTNDFISSTLINQRQHQQISSLDTSSTSIESSSTSSTSIDELETAISADLHVFLDHYPDITSGRAIAFILHGLSSPCYPSIEWKNKDIWGKYASWDLAMIATLATRLLVARRLANK